MSWMKKWFRSNDDEFWENEAESDKITKKHALPIWIFSIIFWYIFAFHTVTLKEYIILVIITMAAIGSTFSLIFKWPYYAKKRNSTKLEDNMIRYSVFLITIFLFYAAIVGIFKQYYPFLEQFICCDFVKNFKLND